MIDQDKLEDILFSYNLDFTIVPHAEEHDSSLRVFVRVKYDNYRNATPSKKGLKEIRARIELEELDVELLVLDPEWESVNRILRNWVLRRFSKYITDFHVKRSRREVVISVRLKSGYTADRVRQIKSHIEGFMESIGYGRSNIQVVFSEEGPSLTTILANLRTISPCAIDELTAFMERKNIAVPSEKWMSRRLDELRRKGLVLRNDFGEFFLTAVGLSGLGSKKGRQSPDVRRALVLARRELNRYAP